MNQQRSNRGEQCAPITPILPVTESAHQALILENKRLRRLLATERRRNQKVVAVLVGHLDELQTTADGLRNLVVVNLAAGLQPKGAQ